MFVSIKYVSLIIVLTCNYSLKCSFFYWKFRNHTTCYINLYSNNTEKYMNSRKKYEVHLHSGFYTKYNKRTNIMREKNPVGIGSRESIPDGVAGQKGNP